MMKIMKPLISLIITAALFYLLNSPFGKIPALGKFFSPYSGFWQNNSSMDEIPESIVISGLIEDVEILWDDRMIPHIFAANTHDLYLAQGYIIARDRLWQMEIQTHNAAGRLSEVIGEQTLEIDRFNRRIGLPYGAEQAFAEMQKDRETLDALNAFSYGVNSWIEELDESRYPLEYKVLGYNPEKWSPFKAALLLKRMCWTLTGVHDEVAMNSTRNLIGKTGMDRFFPFYPPYMDPIIPPGTRWKFKPVDIPKQPEKTFDPEIAANPESENDRYFVGSNNWAISGARTESGYPILCNDPHLGLTLPSIWYEIQLSAPGLNVYGVTLTGMPGVTIGFNSDIAWGLTNAGSDVLDWYRIKFDDERKHYYYNNELFRVEERMEEIVVRGSKPVKDKILYTDHGPVVKQDGEEFFSGSIPADCSMRWTGHDGSNDLLTFIKLNRAKSYTDYIDALSHFDTPAQNFVFASIDGDISITHNGKFPLRWRAQGRYILDGSDSDYDWQGWIPRDHLPRILNPYRGFVSSANQFHTGPEYPYYLGWYYDSYVRGARINDILAGLNNASPRDMFMLQYDVLDIRAEMVLPVLLEMVEPNGLNADEKRSYDLLKNWNYRYYSEMDAPTIFEEFWREIKGKIWEDELQTRNGSYKFPSSDMTAYFILNDQENEYYDNKNTPDKESLEDIIQSAFKEAIANLIERFGEYGENWKWGNTKSTDINHLGSIPGLGKEKLPTNGRSGIVNATGRTFGPSIRMVVSLGPEPSAWTVYPGGQSGNQGSVYYDHMVDDWIEGRYHKVLYLKSSKDTDERIIGKTTLKAGER